MSMAFLETNKVMFSVLAVVAFGGVLIAGSLERGGEDSDDSASISEEVAEERPAEEETQPETTFADMVGDEEEEEDEFDNGFASSTPSELNDEGYDNGFDAEPRSNSEPVFASAPPRSSSRPVERSRGERIVVGADGGAGRPITVDPSRVSPEVGGTGRGDPSETE